MNGHKCTTSSCGGVIQDGYCDTCGNAPAVEVKASTSSKAAPTAVASLAATTIVNGAKCGDAACQGLYEDGYCNTCGNAATAAPSSTASAVACIFSRSLLNIETEGMLFSAKGLKFIG